MKVTILTDQGDSWFVPYGRKLLNSLNQMTDVDAMYVFDQKDVPHDNVILFLLSCVKIVEKSTLDRSKNNIVVHASDLPQGKGFSPLQWQIRGGIDEIKLTLFEASEAVDEGPYYFKHSLKLIENELLFESRRRMAEKIVQMCLEFVRLYPEVEAQEQQGVESFYKRLTVKDDELDIHKSIAEQIDLIRGSDFEKYPLYFRYKGRKFTVKVYVDEQA